MTYFMYLINKQEKQLILENELMQGEVSINQSISILKKRLISVSDLTDITADRGCSE